MKNYFNDELISSINLSQEMEALRSVLYGIYNITDLLVELLLIEEAIDPIESKLSAKEIDKLSSKIQFCLVEISLIRKLKLIKKNKFVNKIKGDIEGVNAMRNWFSHPRVYFREINEIQNDKSKLKSKTTKFRKILISILEYAMEGSQDNDATAASSALIKELQKDISNS